MKTVIPETLFENFSQLVAEYTGLYFTKDRYHQLERAINAAYQQLGYSNPECCIKDLISRSLMQDQIETLAQYLTIGETYFFRDDALFQIFEQNILPDLIKRKDTPLRIWSAGCSTGEEPYSIAILLDKMFGNPSKLNISISATDINLSSIKKAKEGVYSKWSFRTTPEPVKNKYFEMTVNGQYQLCQKIKDAVNFSYLNLARDNYPSTSNGLYSQDIILCRNVLMYFVPEIRNKIIKRFYHCLSPGGLLIVAPSEIPQVSKEHFTALSYPGVIIYQKASLNQPTPLAPNPVSIWLPPVDIPCTYQDEISQSNEIQFEQLEDIYKTSESDLSTMGYYEKAQNLFELGQYNEVINLLQDYLAEADQGDKGKEMALLAKSYANLGKLSEAEAWCNKAINNEKLNPNFRFLLAIILQEQGKFEAAIQSLTRTIYLNPDLVLAHFSMANLYQQVSNYKDSNKYFENALTLLKGYKPEEILPESQGIAAGRLKEIIEFSLRRS